MKISPSIASANPLYLKAEIEKVNESYEDLHVDIEDGNFIPNITFGLKTIKAIRQVTDLSFSFHLMVTNPYLYLNEIFALKPSIIFAHVESIDYPKDFIFKVKEKKVKCGLAFNPKTSIDPYLYLLEDVDAVLIMTSEPDGSGQLFIPQMLEKVNKVKECQLKLEIWLDGAVSKSIIKDIEMIGVTNVVMGREIFG